MTILTGDVRLMKSQVLLDTPDGGGYMTSAEVVDGLSNNLFPDISALDRTYGRIALRKAYVAVNTNNTDSYFGSNVIVEKVPADPRVSVTMFTTKSWSDRRTEARNAVESYLAVGPRWAGHLLEAQLAGQRAIQLALRTTDSVPSVGQSLALVEDEGKATEYSQFVRITKITSVVRAFSVQPGNREVQRLVVTAEISDPLRYTFHGPTLSEYENGATTIKAWCRDTRVANASVYYGTVPLTATALTSALSVNATSIFTQLLPSAQAETPLVDARVTQNRIALVDGRATQTYTITQVFNSGVKMFVGAFTPGTLKLSRGGIAVNDDGDGKLLGATGTQVGICDYGSGVLTLITDTYGSGYGAFNVALTPATAPTSITRSRGLPVTTATRSLTWSLILLNKPARGSVRVEYRAQGRWYVLSDGGSGVLRGVDSSVGIGQVTAANSIAVTLGALPDVGTSVIFSWSDGGSNNPPVAISEAPGSVLGAAFSVPGPVLPGSVTFSWLAFSAASDANGVIAGSATGVVNAATGAIKFIPSSLPPKGTPITINATSAATALSTPTNMGDGGASWTFSYGAAVAPRTVRLTFQATYQSETRPGVVTAQSRSIIVTDDGAGTLRTSSTVDGTVVEVGSIDYSNGNGNVVKSVSLPMNVTTYKPVLFSGPTSVPDCYTQTTTVGPLQHTISGNGVVGVAGSTTGGNPITVETTFDRLSFELAVWGGYVVADGSSFTVSTQRYIVDDSKLITDLSTGAVGGAIAGSTVNVTEWQASNSPNVVGLDATQQKPVDASLSNSPTTDSVTFRTAAAPLRPGSFAVAGRYADGTSFLATAGPDGVIDTRGIPPTDGVGTEGVVGFIDYNTGVATIRFNSRTNGEPTTATYNGSTFTTSPTQGLVDLAADELYPGSPAQKVRAGAVRADSLRYNATAYTYLPLDADLVGLDPVRLPTDGRVPIFRVSDVVVVHHTANTSWAAPTAGATLNVGRVRVSTIKLYDANGIVVDPAMYTTDLDAGTVTLTSGVYSQGALTYPLRAEHRIEDMAVVTDVQINGTLTFNRALTHDYPVDDSMVSSALVMGDLQGRVYNRFSQEAWTNVWSDSRVGNNTTAQYNDVLYPIVTTNRGSTQERWAIIFTNSTAYRVVGESLGQIATGDVNSDMSPINPATGLPYFTLSRLGWGLGWVAGNVLRFNTAAANYPVWFARTILQGPATAQNDGFQVQIRGDVDR